MTSSPDRPTGNPSPPKMGHLPRKYEKMQSHQIKMKIGREAKFGTRNPKMTVPTLETMGKWATDPQINPRYPQKIKVVGLSRKSVQILIKG